MTTAFESDFDTEADELHDLILREIRGDEDARAELERDPREWRDALVEFIQNIDAQFTRRRSEANEVKAENLKNGTKAEWFRYEAGWDEWRGRANGLKRRLVAKLSEVKALIQDQANIARDEDETSKRDLLHEIRDRLVRIEAHLGIEQP